ncbi:MAG: aminoacyl-tRNA deacylase [Candidatus Odinarchaeota archaeon]
MSTKKLQDYLRSEDVKGKFHAFTEHTMTVNAAVKQLGVSPDKIIKSMLFIDNNGNPLLAIVPGSRRVSKKKLARICQVPFVRRATPFEVKNYTGFDVGAVPPVGHKQPLPTYIDKQSMEFTTVIGGGGSTNTLLEISPTDVQRLTKATIHDISK